MADERVKQAMMSYEQRNKSWLTAGQEEVSEAVLAQVTVKEEVLVENQTNKVINNGNAEIGGTGSSSTQHSGGNSEAPYDIAETINGNRKVRKNGGQHEEWDGSEWKIQVKIT